MALVTGYAQSVVARCGSVKLLEEGPRLHFAGSTDTSSPKLLLPLGIVGVHLLGLTLLSPLAGSLILTLGLSVIAGLLVLAFVLVWSSHKSASRGTGPILLTIDRSADTVFLGGVPVGPLRAVRFATVLQFTSSSRALVADTPMGNHVIARGVPGFGSVRGMVSALRQRGIHVH
jgi:hypothetical protein